MKINLISNLNEDEGPETFYTFSDVVAWELQRSFRKLDVTARRINARDIEAEAPPIADHTIVVSALAMRLVLDNKDYLTRLRKSTAGQLCLYLDSDAGNWDQYFDCVFSVIQPKTNRLSLNYIYAGWGASPDLFYPDQKEKTLYLDSFLYGHPKRALLDKVFDEYTRILPTTGIKIYNPHPHYDGEGRVAWPRIQEMLRECHFFCDTKYGNSGLIRLEAATCGALLVVNKKTYMPRTMNSLEYRIWETERELREILAMETNPEKIRKRALEHSWDKTARRILDAL